MFRKLPLIGKIKFFFLFLAISLTLVNEESFAAARRPSIEEENSYKIRTLEGYIDDLKHWIGNQEAELRIFQEKINNQENITESIQQELTTASQLNKNLVKDASNEMDLKTSNLEGSLKAIIADLRQLKSHATETSNAFTLYKQKLNELEKVIELQNQNMASLQTAMSSLMEALQLKTSTGESSSLKTYKIKSGDTLEKIALKNKTTISELKKLNGLTNDRIIVGQTLKMPDHE